MQLEQEDKNKLKQVVTLIESVKSKAEYADSCRQEIKKNGFLLLDEFAFYNNLKELAQSKSKLVDSLQDPQVLDLVLSHGDEKTKAKLFLLAHQNTLLIQADEKSAFNKKREIIPHGYYSANPHYEISTAYSETKVSEINEKINSQLKDLGLNHLQVQNKAQEIVKTNDANWNSKQDTFQLLAAKFGDNWDTVWTSFKQAVNTKSIQQNAQGGFTFEVKELKNQSIEFMVDEKMKLSSVAYYPNTSALQSIRQKSMNLDGNTHQVKPH